MTIPSGWPTLAAAAVLGAFAAFAQAPYDLPFCLILGFAVAFHLFRGQVTGRQAALFGWAFGTGYFAHALQWIVSPFLVDVARHGWMAPFAVLFLSAGLALFWGLAFWAARRLSSRAIWPLLLTLPLAEMIRAYIFTGFPWAMAAQSVIDTPLAPLLALIGPYGVNLVIFACAMMLVASRQPLKHSFMGVPLLLFFGAVFQLMEAPAPQIAFTDHTVRLIQPNAPQQEKWDPEKIPVFFERQLQFTAAPPKGNAPEPDLILWSETAIPWALDYAQTPLAQIAAAAGQATVAVGAIRRDDLNRYNSLAVLDKSGRITQSYDKHHLVPFGEYMPLGGMMARLGVFGLAAGQGIGYATGPGAQVLDFGILGKALPLICYEAVFAHDVNAAPERPDFIIQLTNDAWFGRGAGPEQHLAQARMRAIEQGLPLARSANTGISAMIGPYGQVLASLPLNEAGFVDARLPQPLLPTPYSRKGDIPMAFFLVIACAVATLRARSAEPRFSN